MQSARFLGSSDHVFETILASSASTIAGIRIRSWRDVSSIALDWKLFREMLRFAPNALHVNY